MKNEKNEKIEQTNIGVEVFTFGDYEKHFYEVHKTVALTDFEKFTLKLSNMMMLLRLRKHMSQENLAEKLAVTKGSISRYEKGKVIPSFETFYELAKVLDMRIVIESKDDSFDRIIIE